MLEEARRRSSTRRADECARALDALVGRYYHYRTEQSKALEYLERALELAQPQDDARR